MTNIKNTEGGVIWFTGFSGAGKSTLAKSLFEFLRNEGLKVEWLDGDIVRKMFPSLGFSKEERDQNIRAVGFAAKLLEKNGVYVIASLISPYRESRKFVRNLCKNYFEIFVSTPLSICEARDPKGLYKKARSGSLQQFTGISDPYEPPEHPELMIDTSNEDVSTSVSKIINALRAAEIV